MTTDISAEACERVAAWQDTKAYWAVRDDKDYHLLTATLIRALRAALTASEAGVHEQAMQAMAHAGELKFAEKLGRDAGLRAAAKCCDAAEAGALKHYGVAESVGAAMAKARILALIGQPAVSGWRVPDGWQLVPKVATPEMRRSAHHALFNWREAKGDPQRDPTNDKKHSIRWDAMLAAAPAPPEQAP